MEQATGLILRLQLKSFFMLTLHPTLARDTVEVVRLPLSRVLLMRDRRFPWLILVPEREEIREIHELSPEDRSQLIEEIAQVGQAMERLFQPVKLNVGALGNIVPQLHVHVVARFNSDPAWPGPVWGSARPCPIRTKSWPRSTIASHPSLHRQPVDSSADWAHTWFVRQTG